MSSINPFSHKAPIDSLTLFSFLLFFLHSSSSIFINFSTMSLFIGISPSKSILLKFSVLRNILTKVSIGILLKSNLYLKLLFPNILFIFSSFGIIFPL